MNYFQLEGFIKDVKGRNRQEFAQDIGMSYQALSKRLLGHKSFTVDEVRKIIKVYSLTREEVIQYFYLT